MTATLEPREVFPGTSDRSLQAADPIFFFHALAAIDHEDQGRRNRLLGPSAWNSTTSTSRHPGHAKVIAAGIKQKRAIGTLDFELHGNLGKRLLLAPSRPPARHPCRLRPRVRQVPQAEAPDRAQPESAGGALRSRAGWRQGRSRSSVRKPEHSIDLEREVRLRRKRRPGTYRGTFPQGHCASFRRSVDDQPRSVRREHTSRTHRAKQPARTHPFQRPQIIDVRARTGTAGVRRPHSGLMNAGRGQRRTSRSCRLTLGQTRPDAAIASPIKPAHDIASAGHPWHIPMTIVELSERK